MTHALVTGSAGFIGYHVCRRLLDTGWSVWGFDAFSDYYDPNLKRARHAQLAKLPNFTEVEGRLEDEDALNAALDTAKPAIVIHLAAQAGVRHSIDAPRDYVDSNLIGTFNLLEAIRSRPVRHLLAASTSSVYGANEEMPYRETDRADTQMSFYAATKKATEAMAHSYAHLYGIPTTMFRFFTVYGPWGRPDMAHFKFVRAVMRGEPISIYNHGKMRRDFTYVDDLVEALFRLIDRIPPTPGKRSEIAGDSLSPVAPFRVVNIGNAEPVELMAFVEAIEAATGRKAVKKFEGMQQGDVPATWADTTLLRKLTGFEPSTPLEQGIRAFVAWYRDYYGIAD